MYNGAVSGIMNLTILIRGQTSKPFVKYSDMAITKNE